MIRDFADIQLASSAAVEHVMDIAGSAVMNRGYCTLVLAGGSTPRLLYEMLADPAIAGQMPWHKCHIFWGDERWLASTHPQSNFAMAHKALLSKVDIPVQNIHRMPTDLPSPQAAAENYEEHLRDFFQRISPSPMTSSGRDAGLPRFDLVILGMGPDGHTASLFPGAETLTEKKKWVAAVPGGLGSPPTPRITLTLPVLNQARNVFFLIAGNRKRKVLNLIQTKPEEAAAIYPAARIRPDGNLVWIVAGKDE